MEKRKLGRTGLEVSAIAFGGIIGMDETPEDASRFVSWAVDAGVNYFDVAPSYGNAQERLGPAFAPYRNRAYLACKTQERTAEGAKRELLESLRLLQTEYFDVYQFHSVSVRQDVDSIFGKGGAMETVLWAKREGLVRNVGFSAHSEDMALECVKLYDFDTIMFPLNWAMGINTGWGDRIAENVRDNDRGFIAIKAIIHRAWREGEARRYPKSWCRPIQDNDALAVASMKYSLAKGADVLIPPGNFESFGYMVGKIDECLRGPLTDEEWALLRGEAEAVANEMIFDPNK